MIPRSHIHISTRPLRRDDVRELAPRIRGNDLMECEVFGVDATAALEFGLNHPGLAFAAHNFLTRNDGDEILGAFGVTEERVLWSLWRADLQFDESLAILRQHPKHIAGLQKAYPGYLHNWVLEHNYRALRWLRASGLFEFGPTAMIGGKAFIPFQTKAAG